MLRPRLSLFVAPMLAGFVLLGMAALGAVRRPVQSAAPPRGAPVATPSGRAARSADLPDLVPLSMRIEFESGSSCDWAHSRFGLRALLANQGLADAGPFVVDLNAGQGQETVAGLAAGAQVSVFLNAYNYPGANVLVVDAHGDVAESDEQNNTLSQMVAIPTAPATCTPTMGPGFRAYLPLLLKRW